MHVLISDAISMVRLMYETRLDLSTCIFRSSPFRGQQYLGILEMMVQRDQKDRGNMWSRRK